VRSYETFATRFGGKIVFNNQFIVEKNQRFYLLNTRLQPLAQGDFYYAGLYLGKVGRKGGFFPSFNLLNMMVDTVANKIVVNGKAAWLFICGRDVFASGVVKVMGSKSRGDATLILNEHGECLGFGQLTGGLGSSADEVAVKNVVDVGDFLRRERKK
jgi:ribosome biogenesis protein Nip4